MKGVRISWVVLSMLGILTAYVLYEPVPDGITEPAKYRAVMAVLNLVRLVVPVAYFISRSEEPYEIYSIKAVRNIQMYMHPTPAREVPGSNIRSKVIDLGGVNARLYEPIQKKGGVQLRMPALVVFHGGGMCLGSSDTYNMVSRKAAEKLDMIVVSVDYRLTPEHPFPAGFEDSLTATRYFVEHAKDFDVDQRRIGVGGSSAGGLLAAAVAQAIHDDPSIPDLKVQLLINPFLQQIDLNTPSFQKYTHDFGGNGFLPPSIIAASMCFLNDGKIDPDTMAVLLRSNHTSSKFKETAIQHSYVDHNHIPDEFRDPKYYKTRTDPRTGNDAVWARFSSSVLDPRNAPLMRRDLSGLPPAFIATLGFDALRDDGIFYKRRLEEAGVPVTWVHYEEGFHGVFAFQGERGFKLASIMMDELTDYVERNI